MQVGEIILQKYKIVKLISGDGTSRRGMSNVYKAQDVNLGTYWGIKEIIKEADGKISLNQKAIIQEAQVMRKLQHPKIPRIVSIDNLPDKIYIVMDWVDGKSVGEWLRLTRDDGSSLSIDRSLKIIKEVCDVLSYLHNRSVPVFYRDMKPENIMYSPDSGRVMLLDFGISVELFGDVRITDRIGTKGYYAPESIAPSKKDKSGKQRYFDLRSDIYSLGWTMFHMFTGTYPEAYQKKKKELGLPITGDVREYNSSISPTLAKIIMKCVKKDPKDRYQSIEELMVALEEYSKVDSGVYKKLKNRINIVFCLIGLGVAFGVGSLIPLNLHTVQQSNLYATLLTKAEKSGSYKDWLEVVEKDPTKVSPFLGLISAIKTDGVFSDEEESTILDIINPNIEKLQKEEEWQELAFEVGRLYWLYSESENASISASRWFDDAKGFSDLAEVFSAIGSFDTDITRLAQEGDDVGHYLDQWSLLNKVSGQSDLITIQVNLAKVDMINKYASRLRSDGLTLDVVETEINNISNHLDGLSLEEGTRTFELSGRLKEQLSLAKERVSVVWND